MSVEITVPLLLLMVWGAVVFYFRHQLAALWREPVLVAPVLIVESDDWGPGPRSHALALSAICERLAAYRDQSERPAVMTIGAVLACPDTAALRVGEGSYKRKMLLDPAFGAMRAALANGCQRGVLALQLHGLEHLWPSAFMHALRTDADVQQWVENGDGVVTETLPPALQSRWVDGSELPSVPLPEDEVAEAAAAEVSAFEACFGFRPAVVVPPTFVWTAAVERAWASQGLRTLVTPGRRYTCRDATGLPAGVDRSLRNAEAADAPGMLCLVRDIYFEPSLGHTPAQALRRIVEHARLGRPALIETHRFNFTDDGQSCDQSIDALDKLFAATQARLPDVRFVSSEALGDFIRAGNPDWVCRPRIARLHFWIRRLGCISRLRKVAWATGLALPAALFYVWSKPAAQAALQTSRTGETS